MKNIEIKYYFFIRGESESNLPSAVGDLFSKEKIESLYLRQKCVDLALQKLNKLFERKLQGCVENCSDDDVQNIQDFFKLKEKNICKLLNLQYPKPNIPELPDCKLVACVRNESWRTGYIISGDGHFEGYKPELHEEFNICVLPTNDLLQIMRAWKWKN